MDPFVHLAGRSIHDIDRRAGVIDELLLAGNMRLPHSMTGGKRVAQTRPKLAAIWRIDMPPACSRKT